MLYWRKREAKQPQRPTKKDYKEIKTFYKDILKAYIRHLSTTEKWKQQKSDVKRSEETHKDHKKKQNFYKKNVYTESKQLPRSINNPLPKKTLQLQKDAKQP